MNSDCSPDRLRRGIVFGSAAAAASLSMRSLHAAQEVGPDDVDIHIELRAQPGEVQLRPGAPTRVWHYTGKLLRGEAGALETMPDSYLGPIIRVRRGQRLRIDLINELPEPTIIHWHGLHVPDDMDGHPRFAVAPGERYVYRFTVDNRAGSYWFHPHPHGRTGPQVYAGLAGLFLVGDDEEAALGLPGGAQDLPLVLQDRQFDDDNQFVYLADEGRGASQGRGGMMGGGMMGGRMGRGMMGGGMGSMMADMMGVLGDSMLVNGSLQTSRDVEPHAYRLRLLNGSNTRTLKLAWSDGQPLTVIGSDGGLLESPQQRRHVMLAPAERIELWADFATAQAGAQRSLRSLAFEGGVETGMGMMGGAGTLPDGAPFDILRFKVGSGTGRRSTLPDRLTSIAAPQARRAVNFGRPKIFDLSMRMMAWGINGRSFDMLDATAQETVKLGTHEIWEFRNEGQGAMMGMVMPHAMHVHGLQFRILSRTVSRPFEREYETVKAGLVDDGWKDTVLVMPGERVQVLLHFADHPGLFLYHCHMLEHEDSGLMRNYRVVA